MATDKQHKRALAEAEDEPCSSSSLPSQKRARYSSESAEVVPRFRHSQQVVRPGIPNPIRLSAFKLADKPSPPLRGDDKEGHYNYELGENISSRYKILSKFGEGTFGRVLECWDRKHKDYVAVKIVRNVDKYRHAAMIELEVLNTLEKNDPESKRHCVKLKEWFQYRGHVCMVFEKLGPSLYDFLRRNEYQPLPLALVQAVARQLLVAVAFIHELGLVHTDLKPENILLAAQDHMKLPPVPPAAVERRVPRDSTIRVIDFGSATFEDGYHSSIISTRHYRAPEVILGLGWSYPCDLWSCGCILVELAAGDALFQTHENLEHLAMMQQVLGPIPAAMASRADKHAAKHFNPGPPVSLAWPEGATSRKSLRAVRRLTDLRSLLAARADQGGGPGAAEAVEALADLIGGLLMYEPSQRMTAVEALQHDFLKQPLEMPVGEGSTPEPAALAAAAAAGSGCMPGLALPPGYQPFGGLAALQQGPDAAGTIDQQQQLLQQQQFLAQQLALQQQGGPTGVSGDVAAEAVAAFQAATAAAAAAGFGGSLAAAAAAAAAGADLGVCASSSDVGLQPHAARAAAAAAAAGGVQQLILSQHLLQQQHHHAQLQLQQQQQQGFQAGSGLDDDEDSQGEDEEAGCGDDEDEGEDEEADMQADGEEGEEEEGSGQGSGEEEGSGATAGGGEEEECCAADAGTEGTGMDQDDDDDGEEDEEEDDQQADEEEDGKQQPQQPGG